MTSYFVALLQVEFYKIRKSKVIWLTALAFTIAPLMAGVFMFVLKNPEFAESVHLVGAKAQIAGEANWPSLLNLQAQIIAVGGIFVFGFVNSWVFGREFTDGTAIDLLVLPFSRSLIVVAKFLITFVTNFLLSFYIVVLTCFLGFIIGLPDWTFAAFQTGILLIFIVTILTIFLSTPVAFLASYSRGFLAPLGFVIVVLVFSQIIAALGFGHFFPWSIPALLSEVTMDETLINIGKLAIILVTSLIGFLGTVFWWRIADYS